MATHLERYLGGEREQVWADLMELGAGVRLEPVYSDACAVARETMTRVRANVEMLIPRLRELGYNFTRMQDYRVHDVPFSPPPPDVDQRLEELERLAGVLPISLRACLQLVGMVDFRGKHPDWRGCHDPITLPSIEEAIEDVKETSVDTVHEVWYGNDDSRLSVFLGCDDLLKDGFGGVGPLYVPVPCVTADQWVWFEHQTLDVTFVQNLRNFFRWGGFAGMFSSEADFQRWDYMELPPIDIKALTEGLWPL